MEAGFAGKLKKVERNHESQIIELHAKIGQQSVELDFLELASNRLGSVNK